MSLAKLPIMLVKGVLVLLGLLVIKVIIPVMNFTLFAIVALCAWMFLSRRARRHRRQDTWTAMNSEAMPR